MNWDYRIEEAAKRDLRDLGPAAANEILEFLDKRVRGTIDPQQFGKPLRAKLRGLWRYRVRDWRIICRLEQQVMIVVVIAVGHRRQIYD